MLRYSMSSSPIILPSESLGVDCALALNSPNVPHSQHIGPNMQQHVLTIKSEEEKEVSLLEKLTLSQGRLWGLYLGSTIKKRTAWEKAQTAGDQIVAFSSFWGENSLQSCENSFLLFCLTPPNRTAHTLSEYFSLGHEVLLSCCGEECLWLTGSDALKYTI